MKFHSDFLAEEIREEHSRTSNYDNPLRFEMKQMLREGFNWEDVSFLLQHRGYSIIAIQRVWEEICNEKIITKQSIREALRRIL